MHYFPRLMRELHPGAARPAVDIATRWIRQPIEQVTEKEADGRQDTDLLGPALYGVLRLSIMGSAKSIGITANQWVVSTLCSFSWPIYLEPRLMSMLDTAQEILADIRPVVRRHVLSESHGALMIVSAGDELDQMR